MPKIVSRDEWNAARIAHLAEEKAFTRAGGLDMLNGAYHYMDILPKGRDEDGLNYPQAWIKRRDVY